MKFTQVTTAIAVLVLAVTSANAMEDLADVLPQDALAVIRVTGLHDAWKEFSTSEMWRKIQQAPIPDITSGIMAARAEIENLEAALGIDIETYAASIFGNDVAIALFPDRTGVFVAQSTDTATLDLAVDMILDLEANDGKTFGRTDSLHRGVTITGVQMFGTGDAQAGADGRYHARIGDVFAVSRDMSAVERVIDVLKDAQPSLSESAEYRQATTMMPEGALVRLYVDTDRLSEMLNLEDALNGSMRNPGVRLLARRMRMLLPATRFLAGGLIRENNAVVCKYSIVYDEESLPENMRAMLPRPGAPLDIVRFVPDSALLACSAQFSKLGLWHYVMGSLRESNPGIASVLARRSGQMGPALGGMDFETQFLPQLGDQSAFIVLPGPEDHPPALAFVTELNNGHELPTVLRTLAGSLAMMNQMDAEKKGVQPMIAVENTRYKDVGLMTLNLKQPKLQGKLNPTLFAKGPFLVISTTPESAKALIDAASAPWQIVAPARGTLASRTRVNFQGIRQALHQYEDFLMGQALKEGKTAQRARSDLDSLAFVLGLFKDIAMQGVHVKGRIDREIRLQY